MYGIPCIVDDMLTITLEIANKVRGVAAEKRYTQKRIADTLGIARSSVVARFNGSTPFTSTELAVLAKDMQVSVSRFYPHQQLSADSDLTGARGGDAA